MSIRVRFILALLGCVTFVAPNTAQEKSPDVKKAVELVRKHIDEMKFGKGAGEVIPQNDPTLKTLFPEYQFVLARFRQFPVARILPEGLHPSSIFAVNKAGKIEYLKDAKALEKFFHTHAAPAKKDQDVKTVLAAWLTLTPEFHQDGMFKFEVLNKEFAVNGDKASGRSIVMQGGNGDLRAEIMLDKDGKLAKVTEKAAIRPGPRPICQATKLLDADPLVRRIAEQDLIIMGLSARDYLMEQRAKAAPDLRQAIERVWQQIEKNGW